MAVEMIDVSLCREQIAVFANLRLEWHPVPTVG
jgi:hypothetical protein